jgi:hypothetical protein
MPGVVTSTVHFPNSRTVYLRYRFFLIVLSLCFANTNSRAQSLLLPDAPQASSPVLIASPTAPDSSSSPTPLADATPANQNLDIAHAVTPRKPARPVPQDAHGNPIPLDQQEPTRILGFLPNFRSVSAGAQVPRPGWKYNFDIANHQSFDYSSFFLLSLTSVAAEGFNEHPSLGKGVPGFYAYTWRGFLDKTDGTYLSAWFLPSLLHEDTRFYPLGHGHTVLRRSLYVISREAVARNYDGQETPNIANLGGKVLTQVVSLFYYPDDTSNFGVLAEKFGYSVMRDVGFSAIREFYPDVAAHYIRRHREKVAAQAARDAHPTTP